MPSIFTKIINREIPAEIVWENDSYIAIMDIKPVNPGHLLLIPKQEISSVFEMEDQAYSELFLTAKHLARPLQTVMESKRIGIVVEGFGVDHVHVHLIPINNPGEIDSFRAKEAHPQELTALAEKIRQEINRK